MAIMATIFIAVVPLFVGIRNSTETRWAGLEMLQNARVLNEYLHRHLATARQLVAVSDATEQKGYIEFESANGRVYRLQVDRENRLVVGPAGNLHELVGPVEYVRFICYGGADLAEPTCQVNEIRLVTWEAGLSAPAAAMEDRAVRGACCLRIGKAALNRRVSGRAT